MLLCGVAPLRSASATLRRGILGDIVSWWLIFFLFLEAKSDQVKNRIQNRILAVEGKMLMIDPGKVV